MVHIVRRRRNWASGVMWTCCKWDDVTTVGEENLVLFGAAHAMRCFHGGWSGRVEAGVLGEVDAGSLGGKAGTLLGPLTQKIME